MTEETDKNCPFMMIALAAKANDKAFLYHAKCMGERCALWDENIGRCGLVAASYLATWQLAKEEQKL